MRQHRQLRSINGNTLVSGMIVLLLMALLAIAGLKDALLESQMARNYRQHDQMFQQTESALRYAESLLIPTVTEINDSTVGEEFERLHTINVNPPASNPMQAGSFIPSTIKIATIKIPGSKVRGKGRKNQHTNSRLYRIDATTSNQLGGHGMTLKSIVARGTQ